MFTRNLSKTLFIILLLFSIFINTSFATDKETKTPKIDFKSLIEKLSGEDVKEINDACNTLLNNKSFEKELIKELNNTKDDELKIKIIEILSKYNTEDAGWEIIEKLKDTGYSYISVAAASAKALGEMKFEVAAPKLAELVDSRDIDLKYYSIWALGELNAKSAIQKIIKHFNDNDKTKNNHLVKCAAIQAFAQLASNEELAPLFVKGQGVFDSEKEPATKKMTKEYAIMALETITKESKGAITGGEQVVNNTASMWIRWWNEQHRKIEKITENEQTNDAEEGPQLIQPKENKDKNIPVDKNNENKKNVKEDKKDAPK